MRRPKSSSFVMNNPIVPPGCGFLVIVWLLYKALTSHNPIVREEKEISPKDDGTSLFVH